MTSSRTHRLRLSALLRFFALHSRDVAECAPETLAGIFSGEAGGSLAGLAPLIAEVLGVQPASMGFAADGKRRVFSAAGVAEAEVVGIDGQGGIFDYHNWGLLDYRSHLSRVIQ